jgi:hypothetical protein
VMALLVVFQITACGDKEPQQRKAFIDYLQNTVMRSGQNLPSLSEDQKQKFGNYVNDYNVLVTFSRQVKSAVDSSLVPTVNEIVQIHTPSDYIQQRSALQQSVGSLNMLTQQVQSEKAKADAALAVLKQPDDLKAAYGQVYNKVVTVPANSLVTITPSLVGLTQEIAAVGDFLAQQGKQVNFTNNGVQFPTIVQVEQYNKLMGVLVSRQQALISAQKVLTGDYQ